MLLEVPLQPGEAISLVSGFGRSDQLFQKSAKNRSTPRFDKGYTSRILDSLNPTPGNFFLADSHYVIAAADLFW